MSRASTGGALAMALLAAGPGASAQTAPPVQVVIDACVPVARAEVLRLARIELGLGTGGVFVGPSTTVVMVGCLGDTLSILVDDPVTAKQTERTVRLDGADPRARARLLALAIAESVTTSWSEVAVNPRPALAPARPPPPARVRVAVARAVRRRVPSLRPEARWSPGLGLFASTRSLTTTAGRASLWGGGVRAPVALSRSFGVEADVAVEGGSLEVSPGRISVSMATAGLLLVWRHRWAAWGLRAGGGVRAGVMVLAGEPRSEEPSSGASFAAPWAGPVLTVGASVHLPDGWAIDLGGELGGTVLPVTAYAGEQTLLTLEGTWVGVTLGFGQRP
ncbi:MAG: hypothetical protein Q7V43_03510 [Myxococcales bacterium]|nr:hypothetical protein [Myxococcales bacterium]